MNDFWVVLIYDILHNEDVQILSNFYSQENSESINFTK